jgi:hypothetical protein
VPTAAFSKCRTVTFSGPGHWRKSFCDSALCDKKSAIAKCQKGDQIMECGESSSLGEGAELATVPKIV